MFTVLAMPGTVDLWNAKVVRSAMGALFHRPALMSTWAELDTFLEANKRFHDIIAWSSGNPLFGYLVDSLLGIMDGTVIGIDYPQIRRKAILKAHDGIYKALTARDTKQSEERMQEHIQEYVTYAERKFPNVLDQVIRWGSIKQTI